MSSPGRRLSRFRRLRQLGQLHHLRRLPAVVLNGLAVALGIGLIQLVIGAWGGAHAAQLALSGAVCASLADVPNTLARTWYRVTAAAALSLLAALVVVALKPYPLALGGGVALVALMAMMTMAWGARAGAVSFAPILALVFAMAVPAGSETPRDVVGWQAVGSLAYLAWSLATAWVLRRRYRALAVSQALGAAAALLRARAGLLMARGPGADHQAAMQAWVLGEADLAERLQSARDFVFAQPDSASARSATAIVLRTIDLRDVLLASRLDLDLLGQDETGLWLVRRVADALRQIATALAAAATAVRDDTPPAPLPPWHPQGLFVHALLPAGDARARLLPALERRLRDLDQGAARIHALLHGEHEPVPLTREQLQRFVAPEGWPLRALTAQLAWSSPVLRHALRSALALASAYFIGLALPWASHPHWLVLSVAVVLRGNLEQTLSRRNARVLGTLLGCAVVVALAGISAAPWLGLVFLAAVGTAHASVAQRYWLAATAATVMALLQSHMVNPAAGFAVGERLADTLLGAALAWAFSYVLPSWERRSLPAAVARVLKALHDYASHVLRLQTLDAVEQRLARRQAYEALSALAGTLQRSAVEPQAVRVPAAAVAALLDHGQRLMAHLSLIRITLSRDADADADAVAAGPAATALGQALAALTALLDLRLSAGAVAGVEVAAGACVDAGVDVDVHAGAGTDADIRGDVRTDVRAEVRSEVRAEVRADICADATDSRGIDPEDLSQLPQSAPAADMLPWLRRRLRVLLRDAQQIRRAAAAVLT